MSLSSIRDPYDAVFLGGGLPWSLMARYLKHEHEGETLHRVVREDTTGCGCSPPASRPSRNVHER